MILAILFTILAVAIGFLSCYQAGSEARDPEIDWLLVKINRLKAINKRKIDFCFEDESSINDEDLLVIKLKEPAFIAGEAWEGSIVYYKKTGKALWSLRKVK